MLGMASQIKMMLKIQQLQAAPTLLCLLLPAAAMLCADYYRGRLQKVRVICTGALSNVALLVSLYPEVIPRIEVVLMGGAMGVATQAQSWSSTSR